MIEIKNCPGTLAPGYNTYNSTTLKKVFDNKKVSHILDFSNIETLRKEIDENISKISISGVQEKLSAVIQSGKIILTPVGVQGRYILKPAPDYKRLRDRKYMPANEHLTMQIAKQVYKIPVAENAIIFFKNGEPSYITKRFDIAADNTKIKQEDFASLSRKTKETHGGNFKYTGSYLDEGKLIRQYVAAWQVETIKFYRLVLFNYLFSNGDAHLKNFSLQQTVNGDYILTPAYDLLNTSIHIDDEDFALEGGLFEKQYYSEIYMQKGHPCKEDFVALGKLLEIPEIIIRKTLADFMESKPMVYELVERSFLNDKCKRMYIRGYEERLSRLRRE